MKVFFGPPLHIRFPFDERKAIQVVAHILGKHTATFNYLHLMKMLYTIDRLALAKWGQPVIGGSYCSMSKGPVISEVLDLIKSNVEPGRPHPWLQHFQKKGYDLVLKKPAKTNELSQAEVDLVDTVYHMLAQRNRWSVVEWTHDEFKEWKDPGASSEPIRVEDILHALKKSDKEIETIRQDTAFYNQVDSHLSR